MEPVITYRGAVMTWECDSNHHMNVMYYINKFEHAGRNFDIELGLFESNDVDQKGIVVLEQQVKYINEVFEDDLLYVQSRLLAIGNKAFTVFHEMYNTRSEALVSTMKIVLVGFDKKERKALPFPEDRKAALLDKWDLA